MKTTLEIQNLKCGGCVNTIRKQLNKLPYINRLEIDIDESTVSFEAVLPSDFERIVQKLSALGYPVADEKNSIGKKAKSYIRCAIGRTHK